MNNFFRLRRGGLALLLLFGGLLAARPAAASHLQGGELTYRYLDAGGGAAAPFRYIVTVSYYFNADTVSGMPTQSQAPNGRPSLWIGLYYRGGAADGDSLAVVQLPRIVNRFATPRPQPGCPPTRPVRLNVYRDTVRLPLSFGGYYAYVTDRDRAFGILNIEDFPLRQSDEESMTLYAEIPPPTIPNSSPTFADTAVVLLCTTDTTLIFNSATDADGDRLSYAFGVPYSAPQLNRRTNSPQQPRRFSPPPVLVRYGPGYSLALPFGAATAGNLARLDGATGLSTYRIMSAGSYVVAVDVSEYRFVNGVETLIGRVRRDVQLVARACPAGALPTLAVAIPGSVSVEEGQALVFPIAASCSSPQALLTLKVNSALLDGPGGLNATFGGNPGVLVPGQPAGGAGSVTLRGIGGAGANFAFSPPCGSARRAPYDVLVTATALDCRRQTDAAVYRLRVVPPAAPTAISGDSLICDPTALRTYVALGPPRATYRWRVGGGTVVGAATGNAVQVRWPAGVSTGFVSVRGISAFGCPTDSVLRPVLLRPGSSTPLVVAGALVVCPGSSTTLAVSGGAGAYTLTGGGLVLTGAGPFVVSPAATTTYTVAGVALGGCPATGTATVAVAPAAALVVSGPLGVCPGGSTTLAVSGGAGTYTLAGGGITLTGAGPFVVSPAATTTYTATGRTAAGCPVAGTATVAVGPTAALALNAPARVCPGAVATLVATGGAGSYTLSGGGLALTSSSGTFAFSPTATATYTVAATTAGGCPATGTATVAVAPPAALALSTPPAACPGEAVTLAASGGVAPYTLSGGGTSRTGAGPFTFVPAATAVYTLSGPTADGCPATPATATVVVLPGTGPCAAPDRTLVFPNVITPNGDTFNDVFKIEHLAFYPQSALTVFNRWGRVVYAAADYRNTWGDAPDVAAGVYFFVFEPKGGPVTKGWVEVLR